MVTALLRGHRFGDILDRMTLSDYLAQSETSDTAFAETIGVSRQALWRYKSGNRRPEWDVLERIAGVTDGLVTPNDFLVPPPVPALTDTARAGA